jgi:RNA polymerase sigma-70 factor (ECF subfamily)
VLSLIAAGVPAAQAREFAHDAWLRLIQQASAGRLAYLQLPGLVVRQALFLARAAGRKPTLEAEADPRTASTEEQFFARERLERAREHVETLPTSARQVFLALYSDPGLSHAEVADRVGLSVQRVRQIICEVRKALRAALDEETTHVAHRP